MPARMLLIVFGGRSSSEHEISLRAKRDREDPQGDRPPAVHAGPAGDPARRQAGGRGRPRGRLEAVLENGEPVSDLRKLAPDLVFLVLHGPLRRGRDVPG